MTKERTSTELLALFSRQPVEIKAGAITLAAGLLSLTVPNFLFERLSVALGIAGIVPAAAPPIGYTGRAAIALATALIAGIFAYIYFTRSRSQKQRSRFVPEANPSAEAKTGKSLAERLRRGIGDTLAPKATEWDAKPAAADFRPLSPDRDLGPRFDDSPYLQDSSLAYGEAKPAADGNLEDGLVGGGFVPMTPIPAPPHAEYPELELDPASTLSDPQWRVRPIEEARENMLDLGEVEAIGPEAEEVQAVSPSFAQQDFQQPVEPVAEVASAPRDETSVQELLARLEGALVERASRRAKMRLEPQATEAAPGLHRSEQDMSAALKEALAALQGAPRPL